jgi:hypothetical protein
MAKRKHGKAKSRVATVKALAETAKVHGKAQVVAGRARAERLLAEIARRKQHVAEEFYDLGQALRELLRKGLYRSLGHDTFESMLRARDVMGPTQAYKLIALVEHMSRDEAIRLRQEKAYALLSYTAATPEPDAPDQLVSDDAVVDGKKLSTMSSRELNTAAKKVRAAKRKARKPTLAEREAARHERTLIAALRSILKQGGIGHASIELGRREVVVRIARGAVERLTET